MVPRTDKQTGTIMCNGNGYWESCAQREEFYSLGTWLFAVLLVGVIIFAVYDTLRCKPSKIVWQKVLTDEGTRYRNRFMPWRLYKHWADKRPIRRQSR